ncbi:MAG: UvrD-helicase domain-containing protein [Parachlamydiales bacterium]|nr:UvrD-helicase domain-containing protein [Parachlamydiales bacterium]
MSFNVLSDSTDIFSKSVLEASAGTGKTFAIEHLVVRLLLDDKNDLQIDEILVVTFTKAATAELKYRIRKNIEKALKILKNQDFEKIKIFDYLSSYINDPQKSISKLEESLLLFDTAQIFTIHGFCFRVLKENFFEADVNFLEIDEIENLSEKQISFIEDFLKYSIDIKKFSSVQISQLLNKHKNVTGLVRKISAYLDKDIENPKNIDIENFYKNFQREIKSFENIDIPKAFADFEDYFQNFKKSSKKFEKEFLQEQLFKLFKIINEKFCSFVDFEYFLQTKLSVFEFLDETNKKVKTKNFFELPTYVKLIKEKIYPIIIKAVDTKNIFYYLVSEISEKFNRYLKKEDIFSFDKILTQMQKAIFDKSFLNKVQSKYKAAIIDEFQDTDPVQWDIFEKLFLDNEKILAFYLIGDPKQSIYSFRSADLYTYIDAKEKIKNVKHLDVNYRSSKNLVESLNSLFNENFSKKWLKLPRIDSFISYVPIKSGLNIDIDFQDQKSAIHFFVEEKQRLKKWPTDEMEESFFNFISNEIIRLKRKHSFDENSFAILVKDRFQAQRLQSFLSSRAINSITLKSVSLKKSSALSALKEFFDAVIFPRDFNKIKIALKGPFIGADEYRLKNFNLLENDPSVKTFYLLKKSIANKNISNFFNQFFYEPLFENESILLRLARLKKIDLLEDVYQIMSLLLIEKNISEEKILSFFRKIDLLDDENEKIKRKNIFKNGVQILTTFMSKGLEYDIVFALSLAFSKKDSLAENVDEIDAEKMRNFYVALTRAKYRTYVPIAIDTKEKEIEKGTFSETDFFLSQILNDNIIRKESLFQKLDLLKEKGNISYEYISETDHLINDQDLEKVDLIEPEKIQNFERLKQNSKKILSFTNLMSFTENQQILENKNNDLPIGPEIGVLFHQIFERIFKRKSFDVKPAIKEVLSYSESYKDYENQIFEIVNKTINIPLLNFGFSIKDLDFEKCYSEIEFLYKDQNDYMKGFIDLVFEYNGKFYIVDWKSNYLGQNPQDYEIIKLENAMHTHDYFLQAAIYQESLKRYLKILNKNFEENFGGVFYIFLRGTLFDRGIYHFFPNINDLKNF